MDTIFSTNPGTGSTSFCRYSSLAGRTPTKVVRVQCKTGGQVITVCMQYESTPHARPKQFFLLHYGLTLKQFSIELNAL